MGMDVYGKNPTNDAGKYFRNNVWSWRPLAYYCCEIAPEITSQCRHWQTNDGDGLGAVSSVALAAALLAEVESGRTKFYEVKRQHELDIMPDKICYLCEGTGKRQKPPNIGAGDYMPCNGCKATGKVRPDETHYPFSEANVKEFIQFLENCGGFEIS